MKDEKERKTGTLIAGYSPLWPDSRDICLAYFIRPVESPSVIEVKLTAVD